MAERGMLRMLLQLLQRLLLEAGILEKALCGLFVGGLLGSLISRSNVVECLIAVLII